MALDMARWTWLSSSTGRPPLDLHPSANCWPNPRHDLLEGLRGYKPSPSSSQASLPRLNLPLANIDIQSGRMELDGYKRPHTSLGQPDDAPPRRRVLAPSMDARDRYKPSPSPTILDYHRPSPTNFTALHRPSPTNFAALHRPSLTFTDLHSPSANLTALHQTSPANIRTGYSRVHDTTLRFECAPPLV